MRKRSIGETKQADNLDVNHWNEAKRLYPIVLVVDGIKMGFQFTANQLRVARERWAKNPKTQVKHSGVKEIRDLFRLFALLLGASVLTGCASLPGIPTDKGAAGVAVGLGKPEYAASLEKVADLLVGKRVNPVAGFEREERWYVAGKEVNPSDIKLEVLYRNAYQLNASYMQPSGQVAAPATGEISDKELKAEIEAILKAAGVKP